MTSGGTCYCSKVCGIGIDSSVYREMRPIKDKADVGRVFNCGRYSVHMRFSDVHDKEFELHMTIDLALKMVTSLLI